MQAKSSVDGDAEDKTEAVLVKLLDRTVVCMNDEQPWAVSNSRRQDFRAISRRYDGGDESSLLEGNTPQSEVGLPIHSDYFHYTISSTIFLSDPFPVTSDYLHFSYL